MTVVWRIVREKHAATAFSGVGAARAPGRFNSMGTPVVYTSDSYALAMLEVRVHVATFRGMRDRVAVSAEVDDDLVEALTVADLPPDWQERPAPTSTQALGDAWVASGRSAVLRVPSVVVPEQTNYLLNPQHPDFGRIRLGTPAALTVDPRLR
ncbi:RES family NAD+ phosphorylase [Rubrivirga litoralis]|uniref:RES family NAD+ phosphorylase n=1 Tax=Rubrivirga litoralis TaxID=3075598 RepID=A0ABU3BQ85_9BACT|nr:RES family NAD+ phosphorylase [Rubrivirga sp. F394]MDT0631455.1 RES family NAD+ phosphorylase [Rubrivirga sp. F394]